MGLAARRRPSSKGVGLVAGHVSDVWFRVTDLEVASGRGCVVTTTGGADYLDFTSGIAVTSTGHCHPRVVAAILEQAGRFIHAQVNIYRHTLLEELGARLVIAAQRVYDTAVAGITDGVKTLVSGSPRDEATELGPLVSAGQRERVAGFVDRAVAEGAELLSGGSRSEGPGFFYEPAGIVGVAQGDEIVQREVFGPGVTVQRVGDDDAA